VKALLQRVSRASVSIHGKTAGAIDEGLVILVGITHSDSIDDVMFLVNKSVDLRIFSDDAGKMNLSLADIGGEALIVSQFTLYGDARRGRRPSYTDAGRPDQAIPLYEAFIAAYRDRGIHVETGEFGADMSVNIQNDGPVTLMLESEGESTQA
jgi:D-tyrosyl-tRNA(Tyr) deacylase